MSKMVPSIKERKENASKFSLCYEDICKIQNRMPLPSVKAHLKKNILDFSGDRITCEEWAPILHALSMDRSLHFVGVRSTHCAKTVMEDVATESRACALERVPVLQTRYVLLLLMKAVQACMSKTEVLTCVELEGLPLGPDYLSELIKGITTCRSLRNISLHCSPIGDEGCELMCHSIKGLTNIVSLDFSNCGLTSRGAVAVAETLKYQKIQRYSESWKHTLRYREPDLDSLPGLRRITLNHNVEIGDEGVLHLVDVVRDDIFLKALDLQNCGIGNTGGKAALEMLHTNVSLAIVDLRSNQDLNSELLTQIMRQLHINNQGTSQEYHWIALNQFELPRQPPRPVLHVQSKSQPSVKKTMPHKLNSRLTVVQRGQSKSSVLMKGVPWRVSVRLDRRRECAEVSPGMPRVVQYQEPYPPYCTALPPPSPLCLELKKAKQQLLWMSEQLSAEMVKRRQVEEENVALQQRLDNLLGHNYVLVEKQTMAAIQQSFSEFQNFMQKLRDTGLTGLLDVDVLDLLGKLNMDHKGRLAFLIRKSYSSETTHDKSNQTDLQEVSKSASIFRDADTGREWPAQCVGDSAVIRALSTDGNVVVSSEGTVGTLTCHECSSDSVEASGEDSDSLLSQEHMQLEADQRGKMHGTAADTKESKRNRHRNNLERMQQKNLDKTNFMLYQTVLRKNKEMDAASVQFSKRESADVNRVSKTRDMLVPLEAPADAVLCHRGSTTSLRRCGHYHLQGLPDWG